jgi:ABC-2 type transport system ATP-binding protein
MASGDIPVRARALHKRYGRHVALTGLDLDVGPGQVVGLLGPNGAGKTTTVKILTGLVRASAGTAELFGRPVGTPGARQRLGYLPEHFRFQEWMTGSELLRYHARLAGRDPRRDRARLDGLLELVGLEGRGDERIRGYSKGMTQRLGLAQALVGEPDLVLLDEPTSAMDPLGRREMRELIRRLARDGVVLRSGTLDEVRSATLEVRIRLDRVDDAIRDVVSAHGRIVAGDDHELLLAAADADVVPELAADLVAAGAQIRALVPLRRSLEDAFVGLVQGDET